MIQDNITNMTKPGGVFDSVGKVVGPIFNDLGKTIGETVKKLTGPDGLLTALGDLVGTLWGDGKGPLAQAVTFIGASLDALLKTINFIIGAISELVTGIDKFLKATSDAATVEAQLGGGNLANQGGGMTGPQSQLVTGTLWDIILQKLGIGGTGSGSSTNPALNITLSSDIPLVVDAVNDAQGNAYTVITNTRGR
jgi:hypothetical protein